MIINPIKTQKLSYPAPQIESVLDQYLPKLPDKSIVVITSKIISICQGRVIKHTNLSKKRQLIIQEADYYIPHEPYPGITLTIKDNVLIPSAGIDESNGNGYYILWPKNIQQTINNIRQYLVKQHNNKHIGVIVTDSHTTPLRWGTTGFALCHSGFAALNDYIGKPDIFGKKLQVTKQNVRDGLAAAAVATMGEGNEQTPLAVISDIPFVTFQKRNPTSFELQGLSITPKKDIYAPLIDINKWKKS